MEGVFFIKKTKDGFIDSVHATNESVNNTHRRSGRC
jgi:hypothetical protein